MKKLSLLVATFAVAQFGLAMTPVERETIRQRSIAAEGGIISIAPTGNVLRIVNTQKTLPPSVFTLLIDDVRKIGIDIPFEVSDATILVGQDPLALARSAMLTKKTGAVLAVVEVKDFPTLISAPENGFAIVNLRNLKADKPSASLLNERLTKEFWRGIAYALGAANSVMGSCVLQPVTNMEGLDRIKARRFGSDAVMRIMGSLPVRGIEVCERLTYADACELGIAPAPTNDIQKAIWKKVHEPPKNPMKIEFDPKKGR